MEFFEAPAFTRYLSRYLDDAQYRKIQIALTNTPGVGDLIPGTGGFRKLRWSDTRRGKGRRGGLRIIYYWFESHDRIWMMAIYDKNEASDLTPDQREALKTAIEAEKKTRIRSH